MQYSFRLPSALIERIERRVERENAAQPGRNLTRADIVRELLHEALDASERKNLKSKRRRKR